MRLREYMDMHTIGPTQFARAIGVSVQTVYRYLSAERVPAPAVLERIHQATNGSVLPNDFYQFAVAQNASIERSA